MYIPKEKRVIDISISRRADRILRKIWGSITFLAGAIFVLAFITALYGAV